MRTLRSGIFAAPLLSLSAELFAQASQPAGVSAFELSIEELGNVSVVSQGRRAAPLDRTPAAAYVITADEIRRSGVTTIAEALRLAPGVEVARNGTSSWTISIRGFNSDLSNKLLVLIDGRSVYSPLFAGVFWDAQDTLIADIDRIEIINGPGGTIWGANAVNGVINIITKSAEETHGLLVQGGGGQGEERFTDFRYGAELSDSVDARAYVKHFERNVSVQADGSDVVDDWRSTQAGFNLRWDAGGEDSLTVRGDIYDGEQDVLTRGDFTVGTVPGPDSPGTVTLGGYNVVARWRRSYENGGATRVQFFMDHTDRDIPGSFDEIRDTYDLDWQRDLAQHGRHSITLGTALRMTTDELDNTLFATFLPPERTDRTASAFLQDRIGFADGRMEVTVGSKFEDNDYTGFEYQPNVRYLWSIDERNAFWASVARAVRTPARLNTDINLFAPITANPLPIYVNVTGNPAFDSEDVLAREAGYRVSFAETVTIDLAVFSNQYDKLQTQEPGTPFVVPGPPAYLIIPAQMGNGMEGETHGGRLTALWQPLERWRLRLHWSWVDMDLALKPGSADTGALTIAGNSPERQIGVNSYANFANGFSLYTGVRYISALPNQGLDSRVAVDVNFGWRISEALEASLVVRNLNDKRHEEFDGLAIERGAFLKVTWTPVTGR